MYEKVSVIIPVYNSKKYLKKCLDSVMNQNYFNYEVLIIDDGSTDDSPNIIDEYENRFNNIKAFHNKNNGVSYCRNFGIEKANGEYIMFQDSDDWLANDSAISNLVSGIKDCDFVCGSFTEIWPFLNRKVILKENIYKNNENKESFSEVIFNMHEACWGRLFKKKLLVNNNIKFKEHIKNGEDAIFIHDYMSICNLISCIDKIVYCYNKLESNTLVSKFDKDLFKWRKQEALSRFNAYDKWCSNPSFYKSEMSIKYLSDIFETYYESTLNENEIYDILVETLKYFDTYIMKDNYEICRQSQSYVRKELNNKNVGILKKEYISRTAKSPLTTLKKPIIGIMKKIKQKIVLH